MEITRESPRIRWSIMAVTWALVAVIAVWHTFAMRDYVGVLNQVGRAGAENATPLRRPLPGSFADAQAWVRYALAIQQSGQWQLRFTDVDNAPKGRELHWNSTFAHLISTAGRIQHAITGEALPRATESALAWFNLPLLLGCVILFSTWGASRAGAGAGVLIAFWIVGHSSFYDGFAPNYADHHGLLTALGFGIAFGAMLMGAGWWRATPELPKLLPESPEAARRAAVISALCGALGMWISGASVIPVIGIVGITGVVATVLFGRRAQEEGAKFEPGVWRLWGRVGAIASLVFYCIEYAPAHLSWRLEVNHPFHALAWWGGSELVALLSAWYLDPKAARPGIRQLTLPLLAIAIAPMTILVAGAAAFMVRDPFVGELRHTVAEGMSFRAAAQAFGAGYAQRYLVNFVFAGGGVWLLFLARRDRLVVGFTVLLTLAFVAFACWEIRWWLTASGPLLCLVLIGVATLVAQRSTTVRWLGVLGVSAIVLPSGAIEASRALRQAVRTTTVDQADLLQPLYRDIAGVLRATQPAGEIVLLASPDASNSIGYYGQFKVIGTLYWENVEGLKAAAAIYGAERDDQALELIRARGITHLVYVTKGNFINEFFRLSQPRRPPGDIEKTFAHRVFIQQQLPRWARLIPYRAPANMAMPGLGIMVLQVVPGQTEIEARWNLAKAQLELGNADDAERLFRLAIALAGTTQRAELFQAAGDLAYQQRADAVTIRLYRESLALGNNLRVIAELGWLLSSSANAALRNGREALARLEPALKASPNDVILLNAYAGALAETGRFAEAIEAANRALTQLHAAGDAKAEAILQRRLDAYRANHPWRE